MSNIRETIDGLLLSVFARVLELNSDEQNELRCIYDPEVLFAGIPIVRGFSQVADLLEAKMEAACDVQLLLDAEEMATLQSWESLLDYVESVIDDS